MRFNVGERAIRFAKYWPYVMIVFVGFVPSLV